MNLDRSVVVLRARGPGEVLDLTFRFASRFARDFAKLGLVTLGPAFAITVVLRFVLSWSWAVVWLFAILFTGFLEGPFTVLVSRLMFGERPRIRQTLAAWRAHLGQGIGSLLRQAFFYVIGGAIIIGAPYVAVSGLYIEQATYLEQLTVAAAADRSRRLASSDWGASTLAMFQLFFARGAFLVFAEILGHGLVDSLLQLGHPFGRLLHDGGSLYALAGFFAATPFVASARFLHYIDVRTRTDAWDVQVRFMNLLQQERARTLLDEPESRRRLA
jgi:hypothetical protein